MVSHLFYYQLALLALVWLFLMVHVTWPKRGVTPPPASAQPEPLPPKRTRAHEPTPFDPSLRNQGTHRPAQDGKTRKIKEGFASSATKHRYTNIEKSLDRAL